MLNAEREEVKAIARKIHEELTFVIYEELEALKDKVEKLEKSKVVAVAPAPKVSEPVASKEIKTSKEKGK